MNTKESCTSKDTMNELETKVKLLEKDIEIVNNISEKLGDSIEKIQEMSMNLVKMISLHDQKHLQHEKSENELKEDIKELYARIASVSREIHDRIDQVEHHIASRIDALRSDLITHKKEEESKPVNTSVETKIADIEKWRWTIVGAVAILIWFIDSANLIGKMFK